MPTISLCMIVKNEEGMLEQCLNSVKGLADEIIIVDTGSTDRTKQIARKFTDKIFDFRWVNDFSAARNESLKHATGEWILILDADETLSEDDHSKIRAATKMGLSAGFTLLQRDYHSNSSMPGWQSGIGDSYEESRCATGWNPVPSLRLFKNHKNVAFKGRVHEGAHETVSKLGSITELDIPIHHYGKLDEDKLNEKNIMYEKIGKYKADEKEDFYSYLELGKQYFVNKKVDKAIEAFEKSIELKPNHYDSWFQLGSIYLKLGQLDKAISHLEKARSLKEDFAPVYSNLGIIYAQKKDFDMAFHNFHKVIKLNPKDATTFKNIGMCAHEIGDREMAYAAFKRAIELNPEYAKEIKLG